jgi:hypothetical protein
MLSFVLVVEIALPGTMVKALAILPILVPLGEFSGITRQSTSLIFAIGDAFPYYALSDGQPPGLHASILAAGTKPGSMALALGCSSVLRSARRDRPGRRHWVLTYGKTTCYGTRHPGEYVPPTESKPMCSTCRRRAQKRPALRARRPGRKRRPFMWFSSVIRPGLLARYTTSAAPDGRFVRTPRPSGSDAVAGGFARGHFTNLKRRFGWKKSRSSGIPGVPAWDRSYALKHPEELSCYIGVGQLVNGRANEATAQSGCGSLSSSQ